MIIPLPIIVSCNDCINVVTKQTGSLVLATVNMLDV
jgi:hypothetical protein